MQKDMQSTKYFIHEMELNVTAISVSDFVLCIMETMHNTCILRIIWSKDFKFTVFF